VTREMRIVEDVPLSLGTCRNVNYETVTSKIKLHLHNRLTKGILCCFLFVHPLSFKRKQRTPVNNIGLVNRLVITRY